VWKDDGVCCDASPEIEQFGARTATEVASARKRSNDCREAIIVTQATGTAIMPTAQIRLKKPIAGSSNRVIGSRSVKPPISTAVELRSDVANVIPFKSRSVQSGAPVKFALENFLYEHFRDRANAKPEEEDVAVSAAAG